MINVDLHTDPMLPSELPVLENSNVVLRAFRESDVSVVASAASDPMIPLITTVPTSGDPLEAAAYIQRQHDRLLDGTGYSFAVADPVTDEAVGQIGLWTEGIAAGRASTGYWIGPGFRHRGFARAALGKLTAWAMALAEVERLALFVEPSNEASWCTAESCGYQREGLLRSWAQIGEQRRDMYVYSRVASD